MLGINIDIQPIVSEFYFDRSEVESFSKFVIEVVASKFAKEWAEEAESELHSTRSQYTNSIYVQSIDDKHKVVGLAGWLPNAIEQGSGAFDEKKGLEGSSKKHIKKSGGWYITIPLRWASSSSLGESSVFSGQLPDEVQTILKNKSKAGDTTGIKKSELPTQFQIPSTRPKVEFKSQVFEEYTHKAPIHEGIVKSQMQYNSQYTSFRRVSDLSDTNSWVHTGFEAKNLAEKALQNINISTILDKAVDNFLLNR